MAPPTLTNWLLGLVSALLALLIAVVGWQFRSMDSRLESMAASAVSLSVNSAVLNEQMRMVVLRLDRLDVLLVKRP